jgi:hypothetical protein
LIRVEESLDLLGVDLGGDAYAEVVPVLNDLLPGLWRRNTGDTGDLRGSRLELNAG